MPKFVQKEANLNRHINKPEQIHIKKIELVVRYLLFLPLRPTKNLSPDGFKWLYI